MDGKEILTPWCPIEGLSGVCYIDSVHNDTNGFNVVLVEISNNNRKLNINFPFGVRSYRATDELLSINALKVFNVKTEAKVFEPWSLFKVTNSEYLYWASQRSDGISNGLDLIHFAICTTEWTLEMLDNSEPLVKFIPIE